MKQLYSGWIFMVSTVANAIQLGAQMFTNTIYTNHRLQRFIRKESGLIDFYKCLEKILCFKREKIVHYRGEKIRKDL